MTPEYIVIHTAAFRGRDCDCDRIDKWHKARRWSGVGYHYVILNDRHSKKPDGLVEKGRADHQPGAHALGLNDRSLGICCVGHGDEDDFTDAQYQSLYNLVEQLMQQHGIPVKHVIGHRELNDLVEQGELSNRYRTSKSCPGKKVDMDTIRQQLSSRVPVSASGDKQRVADDVKLALSLLNKHRQHFPNAQDELDEFIYQPEVLQITQTAAP